MFDPPPRFEGAGECAMSESELAVGEECLAPSLCRVGFAPRVAAVRMSGEVERLPRCLDGLGRIGPGEPDGRQRHEQLDSEEAEAAGDMDHFIVTTASI